MAAVTDNSRRMYQAFARLVAFKSRFFSRQITPRDRIIVELLSGNGANLELLRQDNDLSSKTVVCIDRDFASLQQCQQKGFLAVQADANHLPFRKGSVDLFLSNSFHHIPSTLETVIRKEVMPSLKEGGRLAGVEGNGVLTLLIIRLISLLPRWLARKGLILNEFYEERREITQFLKLKFERFLLGFEKALIRKNPLYLFYTIEK